MLTITYKLLTNKTLTIAELRMLVERGRKGIAHKYADHVRLHYKDHGHSDRVNFTIRQ